MNISKRLLIITTFAFIVAFLTYYYLFLNFTLGDISIEKAKELIDGIDDDIGKAIKLFYFVRDGIRYSVKDSIKSYNKEEWKSSLTLKKGYGFWKAIPFFVINFSLAIKHKT